MAIAKLTSEYINISVLSILRDVWWLVALLSILTDENQDGFPENPSSLWDSVVAWMRSAVEFIGLEATPTAGSELSEVKLNIKVSKNLFVIGGMGILNSS